MDLISIIIIIVIISKVLKKGQEEKDRIQRNTQPQNPWDSVVGSGANTSRTTAGQRSYNQGYGSQAKKNQAVTRETIENTKRRLQEKYREVESEVIGLLHSQDTYEMPKQNVRTTPAYEQLNLQQTMQNETRKQSVEHRQQENREALEQVRKSRMEARNTTILQRAKANAEEDKVDVTLETMEAEHNHSERVSAAVHHHPEDEIPENMLGKIEDLMIKGYDGNLCFERDFVGEAMDMINRFTISTDIPNPSTDEVA